MEAEEIHAALNEPALSVQTSEVLERVGTVLGEREGTGPDHDPLLRSQRRRVFERGHERGVAHGGRAAERALLRRQAARKFDCDTARQLAALLEQADADRLAQAGIWLLECETGAELLDRLSGKPPRWK